MKILAIESSCDETAAAVVLNGRTVLSSVVFSQADIHKTYGGVVPEIASRKHIEVISQVTDESLKKAGLSLCDIDGVGATFAPGLIGALLVGLNFAKGLCAASNIPLIPVHHIRAHIAANYLEFPDLAPPFLCLVASGGHSHIVMVNGYTDYTVLGRTRDDAAGEAFDKAARVLDLPYPGGVWVDKLAKEGNNAAISFPRVNFENAPYDFSFSGVKTSVINYVHNAQQKGISINKADVAASFNEAIAEVLCDKLFLAAKQTKVKTVAIAGGVAANSRLRELLKIRAAHENIHLMIPSLKLCGDNAAMVGSQAYFEFNAGHLANFSQNAYASLDISYRFDNVM